MTSFDFMSLHMLTFIVCRSSESLQAGSGLLRNPSSVWLQVARDVEDPAISQWKAEMARSPWIFAILGRKTWHCGMLWCLLLSGGAWDFRCWWSRCIQATLWWTGHWAFLLFHAKKNYWVKERSKTACWMGLFKIITFTQFSHRCLIGFS